MKALTPEQAEFIDKTKAARDRCAVMAAKADQLQLGVLAREWDYIGKCLDGAIGNQMRAFLDNVLLDGPEVRR